MVFFARPDRLAIVGDVLFQGSIGRTDFPKGDFETLISSIRNRLWPLGNDVAFIPGHGPMSVSYTHLDVYKRQLPKTRSGKLLRRSIQALAEGRDPGDLTTIEDPKALEQLQRALGTVKG